MSLFLAAVDVKDNRGLFLNKRRQALVADVRKDLRRFNGQVKRRRRQGWVRLDLNYPLPRGDICTQSNSSEFCS